MMLSHKLTHSRRSLNGPTDWWPFPIPGMAPPADPLSCMMRYPEYTWNASTNKCVSTVDPSSAGAQVYWYMEQACGQLPSCRWDYANRTCACSNTQDIAPQSDGTASTCPAGSMAIPAGMPGAGTCFPTSGPNVPAWPWAPPGSQTPVNPNVPTPPPSQTQQQVQSGWWSQQTDTTKALVIGGSAVAAIGLVLLLTAGRSKGPAIVYTSGQPMTANKSPRTVYFDATGKRISGTEAGRLMSGGYKAYERDRYEGWFVSDKSVSSNSIPRKIRIMGDAAVHPKMYGRQLDSLVATKGYY